MGIEPKMRVTHLRYQITVNCSHSCQYRTIRGTYHTIRTVLYVKNFISYQRIVSAYELYATVCVSYESYRKIIRIVRYINKYYKMRFFVKICNFYLNLTSC